MDALDKLVVLGRIADEARIILNNLVDGGQILDDELMNLSDRPTPRRNGSGSGPDLWSVRWSMTLGPACLQVSKPVTADRIPKIVRNEKCLS
jgi:hypothetical protein